MKLYLVALLSGLFGYIISPYINVTTNQDLAGIRYFFSQEIIRKSLLSKELVDLLEKINQSKKISPINAEEVGITTRDFDERGINLFYTINPKKDFIFTRTNYYYLDIDNEYTPKVRILKIYDKLLCQEYKDKKIDNIDIECSENPAMQPISSPTRDIPERSFIESIDMNNGSSQFFDKLSFAIKRVFQ